MQSVLREIQGQLAQLRTSLTRLENVGLLVPYEARFDQLQAALLTDAEHTKGCQQRVGALIEALKTLPHTQENDVALRVLEEGWGQVTECWPHPSRLTADSTDRVLHRAVLTAALLDGLMKAIDAAIV